ncbi:unnamed protein product [Symbiodinium necroappetens]|uniref:Uncharacterized protein n=1 Tax=Symbiodinium necroappetens TaxID=1628268 RepID=A0A812XST2_9DINO|nr:unnamed protein product [Symbiodinium necroappetens]
MGLTPDTKTTPRSKPLEESPAPATQTCDDPKLKHEIDVVSKKLETELKLHKEDAKPKKGAPKEDAQPKKGARKTPAKTDAPKEEPKPGCIAAAVKAAVNTSVTKPKGNKLAGKPKAAPKASSKAEGSKAGLEADDHEDSNAGSADEHEDSDAGSADNHEGSDAGSADNHEDSDAGSADEGGRKKSAAPGKKQSPKTAAPKKKATPKATSKKNDSKKQGKNKIDGEASGSSGKRPAEPKPKKKTALTEGWKKFSQDYFRDRKNEGKKLSQLMKEASEMCEDGAKILSATAHALGASIEEWPHSNKGLPACLFIGFFDYPSSDGGNPVGKYVGCPMKEPTNLVCQWTSDADPVVFETTEGRRLKDADISIMRLLIEEMETNGVVDLTLNSHDMERCDEGDDEKVFVIGPSSEVPPLVFKFTKNNGQNVKFTNAASFFDNRTLTQSESLRMVWRVSFNADEQEISPKKPLYFMKNVVEMQKQQVLRLL